MKITIISGSHRENSQSYKVAKYIQKTLDNGICDETWIMDLAGNPLLYGIRVYGKASKSGKICWDPLKNS